jgi:hypothetical protein
MTHLDIVVYSLALPLTIAVVQVLKEAGIATRYAGLAALGTGICAGLLVRLSGVGSGPIALAALTGAIAGLSAAGVWSGARALRE